MLQIVRRMIWQAHKRHSWVILVVLLTLSAAELHGYIHNETRISGPELAGIAVADNVQRPMSAVSRVPRYLNNRLSPDGKVQLTDPGTIASRRTEGVFTLSDPVLNRELVYRYEESCRRPEPQNILKQYTPVRVLPRGQAVDGLSSCA